MVLSSLVTLLILIILIVKLSTCKDVFNQSAFINFSLFWSIIGKFVHSFYSISSVSLISCIYDFVYCPLVSLLIQAKVKRIGYLFQILYYKLFYNQFHLPRFGYRSYIGIEYDFYWCYYFPNIFWFQKNIYFPF